jgi:hypothetical protein
MKTKLQILKESIIYIVSLGVLDAFFFGVFRFFLGDENWVTFTISGLFSFTSTCVMMGYLFEKEKPIWLASIQYIVIGFFSAILTILIILLGFPFVSDLLINQVTDFFKNQFVNNWVAGFLMIIVYFLFVVFGLLAYVVFSFFLGNLIFSFLLQWTLNKYTNPQK